MARRSIFSGPTPSVIIKTGSSVVVEGWDGEQVVAESSARGALDVKARSSEETARARAVIGIQTIFDMRLKLPNHKETDEADTIIVVQIGGDGKVRVPHGSRVTIYAGKDAQVRDIQDKVAIYTGGDGYVRRVHALTNATTGGSLDLECETIAGDEAKYEAGRDLRCYVRSLVSARVFVNDLGGYWEGVIGAEKASLQLNAGGEAILVTNQKVTGVPPHYLLGQIEEPPLLASD